MELETWFRNAGGFSPDHSLETLDAGLDAGLLDEQDEYGMTALSLAAMSKWTAGVERLLEAGADVERTYYRTGEGPLMMVVLEGNEGMARRLAAAGANPDAPNHFGAAPREIRPAWFESIDSRPVPRPPWRLQNAEHLADHYHPKFKIPERMERESLMAGVAVKLYVFGPRGEGKSDSFKVRIRERIDGEALVYVGDVETDLSETHLPPDVGPLRFGPEHVATVFLKRPG